MQKNRIIMTPPRNSAARTIRVILTGATGMVGEGVLLECLQHPAVEHVLLVTRKPYRGTYPKLEQCFVPDFLDLSAVIARLNGYDACFFCAGVSSVGMSEAEYTRITYDTTLNFAHTLAVLNPNMTFCYVSGALTDSSEKGRTMWARVKGKTENALLRLPFARVYNFRPGFMRATPGQQNIKSYYSLIGWLYPLLRLVAPNHVSTLHQVGQAMIRAALDGAPKPILEIKDINALADKA
jgi:uncharacterized protein YbjT (DUF2867 family)